MEYRTEECMRINPWSFSTTFNCKPLSANKMYTIKRTKTHAYNKFQKNLRTLLGDASIDDDLPVKDMRFKLIVVVTFSNKASDLDNALKPLIDTLQDHFGFDDKNIYEIEAKKLTAQRGQEKIDVTLEQIFLGV